MESFYISKRAKDGNYLKKKKEESGNVTYIYSDKHVKERNKKKAKRLSRLSRSLKSLRAQVKKDITNENDRIRLAAIAVALIDETFERVGNRYSAAEMKHYGITTLLSKHVKFSGSTARIKYVGKSGVKQDKTVKTPKVVSALKKLCSGKKPSDLVFELDDFTLTDNNVNQYLRPFNITAKDIRGLHANVEVRKQLQKMKKGKDEKERKENFKEAIEEAAKIVGHKASTLKNQYLVPGFEEKYVTKGEIIGPKTAAQNISFIKEAEKKPVEYLKAILDYRNGKGFGPNYEDWLRVQKKPLSTETVEEALDEITYHLANKYDMYKKLRNEAMKQQEELKTNSSSDEIKDKIAKAYFSQINAEEEMQNYEHQLRLVGIKTAAQNVPTLKQATNEEFVLSKRATNVTFKEALSDLLNFVSKFPREWHPSIELQKDKTWRIYFGGENEEDIVEKFYTAAHKKLWREWEVEEPRMQWGHLVVYMTRRDD